MPQVVEASVFSYMVAVFGHEADANNASVLAAPNSQTMKLLEATRNADPEAGKGGGDITIVGGTALLAEAGPSGTIADIQDEKAHSDQISVYVVREGDTLSGIAKMFGVSINTIVWANDISGGKIAPGTLLTILPITGIQHTVLKGETLASIAKKYKADLGEIKDFNNITGDTELLVGMVITVPDGEITSTVVRPSVSNVRGANAPTYVGYYIRPIIGGHKSQGLHGYNGIDLAIYQGAPIYASAAGVVIISKNYGWNGGYGNYVVIAHPNGTQTLYAHMSVNASIVGEQVAQGQIIGYVGASGHATGPHVHFEIRGARNPF